MMSSIDAAATASIVLLDGTSDHGKDVLGGKAWGVNKMASLGLPVPPAFALPADRCADVNATGSLPPDLVAGLRDGISYLERVTGRRFGATSGPTPLLVSVRSGAAVSMPGMMDTVLNLGLTPETSAHLASECGDPAWVEDLSKRFEEGYRSVVSSEADDPPCDPWQQLEASVIAVYASWESPRARAYRAHNAIAPTGGTAVTVQAMVFGNADDRSGTGVLFTRNPLNGDSAPYGEWLARAQGEDVVSGAVTPQNLVELRASMPDVHAQLMEHARQLEQSARDVQDIEFTVESGRLWILQTRTAKRAPQAAVRLAVGLVNDGLRSPGEALLLLTPDVVARSGLCSVRVEVQDGSEVLAKGEAASPGRASGLAVGDPDEAQRLADDDVDVVLVRATTSPADVHGMFAAAAVVTDLGGSTSHAALVSREIGLPCVVGCGAGTAESLVGKRIRVDGTTGEVTLAEEQEQAATNDGAADPAVLTLMQWARQELAASPQDERNLVSLLEAVHTNQKEVP